MQKIIIGSVFTLGVVLIAACSAPPSGLENGESKSPDKGSSSSSGGSSSGGSSSGGSSGASPSPSATSTSTSPTEPPPAAGACAPSQGVDACNSCCEAKFPKGLAVQDKLDDTWSTCVCASNVCATQCATTECSENGPDYVEGDACDTCVNNATACNNQDETACDADADCKQLSDCYDVCDP